MKRRVSSRPFCEVDASKNYYLKSTAMATRNLFILIGVTVVLAVIIFNQIQLHSSVSELQKTLKTLQREIAFLQSTYSSDETTTDTISFANENSGVIIEEKKIFDSSVALQILFFISLQLLELWNTTSPSRSAREEKGYLLFLTQNTPFGSSVFYLSSCILGWAAYLNILNRQLFFEAFVKYLVLWNLSIYLANIVNNFIRISRYFPSSFSSLQSSLVDRHWWWWVISRTLGIDTLENIISLVIFLLSRLIFIWPFRYFYYYTHTCSSSSDAMYSYLVNTVTHVTTICAYSLILQLSTFGTSTYLRTKLFLVSSDLELVLSLAVCGYQILSSLLRYLWLFSYGRCTAWGSIAIAPLFTATQVFILALLAPILFADTQKKVFCKNFMERLKAEVGAMEGFNESEFHDVLDSTTKLFVFSTILKREYDADASIEEERDTVYFERLFQHEVRLRKESQERAGATASGEERNYDGEERNEDDAGKGDSDGVSPPKASGSTDAEDVHSSNNAAKNKSD